MVTRAEDGSSVSELTVDSNRDGEPDYTLYLYRDAEQRLVQLEYPSGVQTYSDYDEHGNYQRSETTVGEDLLSVCTYAWRGRAELVASECVRQPEGTVSSRITITWEGDREVLRVFENDGAGAHELRETRRDTLSYDDRGWLERETWEPEGEPGTDLRYGYACWE